MLSVRYAAFAATIAIAAHAHNASAQTIELRDRDFIVGSVLNYEQRDLVENSVYRADPSRNDEWIQAVNGKLVWTANVSACPISMVYLPGHGNSGKVDCKPERSGTASNWTEKSSTATFTTSATVQGNVLTLHGEMKGTYRFRMNHCNYVVSDHTTQFTVTQTLKLRISGNTCQMLEMDKVESEDETGTLNGKPVHKINRTTTTASGSCRIELRSAQQPTDEKLEAFDMPCQ
jgi:hypothetical protein